MNEKVIVIDPAIAPEVQRSEAGNAIWVDIPASAYWFASVPVAELTKKFPSAISRYKNTPHTLRLLAWFGIPSTFFLLGLAFMFLFVLQSYLPADLLGAVIFGLMLAVPGVGVAWWVVRRFLKTTAMWALFRMPAKVKGKVIHYELVPVVPAPVMAEYEAEAEALFADTNNMLWTYEMLELGVEGKSREQYLRLMGAASVREIMLRQGVISTPPTLDQKSPADRNPPGSNN